MSDKNDRNERRGADGEPLPERERGTAPQTGSKEKTPEPPVDETDSGPAPTIRAEDAKYA